MFVKFFANMDILAENIANDTPRYTEYVVPIKQRTVLEGIHIQNKWLLKSTSHHDCFMSTLSSLVVPKVVKETATNGATGDEIVGIMSTLLLRNNENGHWLVHVYLDDTI